MTRLGEPDWRFAHPQADMLMGVNLSSIVQSSVVRTLIARISGSQAITAEEQQRIFASMGDVDQVCVSVRADDVLGMITGRLDSLPQVQEQNGMRYQRISADRVLFGKDASLAAANRRLAMPGPLVTPQIQKVNDMAGRYDLWVAGNPGLLSKFGMAAKQSPLVDFVMGISFNREFRMEMLLTAVSEAAAQQLYTSMTQRPTPNVYPELTGRTAKVTVVMSETQIADALSGAMAGGLGKQLQPLLAAARTMSAQKHATPSQPAPAAAPSDGKVKIFGLDDGPKEVQLSK